MQNLTASRHGFKFDRVLKSEGNKSDIIRFEVSYLKSFSGRKGIVVHLTPKTVEQHEGYTMETLLLYNSANVSAWVKMLARKNDKAVVEMAEKLDAAVPSIIDTYQASGPDAAKAAILAAAEVAQ